MKKIVLFFACFWLCHILFAQGVNNEVKLKELAVPKAPALKLLDLSPTQIENPTNPKEFALGIVQSFSDSAGWPRNYSMEFTPYWWLKSSNRSIYDFLGLRTVRDATGTKIVGEDAFSGLKFTSVSLAFINQDLIPDDIKQSQKVFSVGVHSTIVKVHSKHYAKALATKLKQWHDAAQQELELALANAPAADSPGFEAYWQQFTDMDHPTTSKVFSDINDIMNERPLFSLDGSAAYANYGINDSIWKTGRTGIWATVSSHLPLKLNDNPINRNYFAVFGYLRFLQDNYAPGSNKQTLKSSCTDIGAKIELQFDKLSIGFETIQRKYSKSGISAKNRNVGVINYQLGNNLYINGAFGKDFDITNKLISFLGINWGLGNEKIKL